jgi:hypothetical protein
MYVMSGHPSAIFSVAFGVACESYHHISYYKSYTGVTNE